MQRRMTVIMILVAVAVSLLIGKQVLAATATQVTFTNGLPAPITQHNKTTLDITVPVGAVNGEISVTADTGTSNPALFNVGEWFTPDLADAATSAVITASGTLTENTVWNEDILVTGNVIVPAGITLTIEPGVTVLFSAADTPNLQIKGTLTAVGTPAQPIFFTSDAEIPDSGDWDGIKIFKDSPNAHLAYCGVQYAEHAIYFYNHTSGAGLSSGIVDHCNIQNNESGIRVLNRPGIGSPNGTLTTLITMTHNLIQNNHLGVGIVASTGDKNSYDASFIANNRIEQNNTGLYLMGNHWGTDNVEIRTEVRNNIIRDNNSQNMYFTIKNRNVVVAPIIENNLFNNTSVMTNTHLLIAGVSEYSGWTRAFSPTIRFNTFANAAYGIETTAARNDLLVSPVIDHNIFYDISEYAINNTTDDTISVEQNYWGTNEAEWDSGAGSMVSGNLTATNHLDSNSAPILTYVSPGLAQTGDAVTLYGANFGENTAPVAQDDAYSTYKNESLSITTPGVLANDADGNWNELTAVIDTNVTHGTLQLNGNGSFIYTPNTDFIGEDSFTYHAHDGQFDSNIVTVTITVEDQTEFFIFLPMIVK